MCGSPSPDLCAFVVCPFLKGHTKPFAEYQPWKRRAFKNGIRQERRMPRRRGTTTGTQNRATGPDRTCVIDRCRPRSFSKKKITTAREISFPEDRSDRALEGHLRIRTSEGCGIRFHEQQLKNAARNRKVSRLCVVGTRIAQECKNILFAFAQLFQFMRRSRTIAPDISAKRREDFEEGGSEVGS